MDIVEKALNGDGKGSVRCGRMQTIRISWALLKIMRNNEEKAVIVLEKALQKGAKSLIMNGFSASF